MAIKKSEVAEHWNEQTNKRERQEWLQKAGDDPSLWTKDWNELPARTRESILRGAEEGELTGNFSAFDNLSKEERVAKIEQAGHGAAFAARWAGQKLETLPEDVRTLFVGQPRNLGREYRPEEWDGLEVTRRDELLEIIKPGAKQYADWEFSQLSKGLQQAIRYGKALEETAHAYEAQDRLKPGGKFSAKFSSENDTAVWWNEKSEAEKVKKLRKLFPDEEDTDHQEVAAQAWKDLPLPVRRALTELHTRSTYGAKFASRKDNLRDFISNYANPDDKPTLGRAKTIIRDMDVEYPEWKATPEEVLKVWEEMNKEAADFAGVSAGLATAKGTEQKFSATPEWDRANKVWSLMDEDDRAELLTNWGADEMSTERLKSRALIGLPQKYQHAAMESISDVENFTAKKFSATPEWDRANKVWSLMDEDDRAELLTNWGADEMSTERLKSRALIGLPQKYQHAAMESISDVENFTAKKFSVTIPTGTGEETKQFDSDTEAVKFLAEQGYLNDQPRALRRLRSTGKWSAASKARIETIE